MKKLTLTSLLISVLAFSANAADNTDKKIKCMEEKTKNLQKTVLNACGIAENFDYKNLNKKEQECLNTESKKHEAEFNKLIKECK